MSTISVIQIFKENNDPQKIIKNNSIFLNSLKVEYMVYDCLKTFEILKFIRDVEYVRYFKSKNENLLASFFESSDLSTGNRLIFLDEFDYLNERNVLRIEGTRINILKEDLHKIKNNIIHTNNSNKFNLEYLYLYLKKEKSLGEKIKLAIKTFI